MEGDDSAKSGLASFWVQLRLHKRKKKKPAKSGEAHMKGIFVFLRRYCIFMMARGDRAREKGECCALNLKERVAGSYSVSLLIWRFQP